MDSPQKAETLVQEGDIMKLLSIFATSVYDSTTNDPEKMLEYAEIEQKCVLMFAKDYEVRLIDNEQGSLSATYPGRIVSLALSSNGADDQTAKSEAHKVRTARLRGHMEKARGARARTRFAVPVILYDGKYICRSATLSGGLEIYSRALVKFLSDSTGFCVHVCRSLAAGVWEKAEKQEINPGESELEKSSESARESESAAGEDGPATDSEDTSEKDDSAVTEADASLHGELRKEDIQLLKDLSVGQICDLMVEGKKAKYSVKVTSSEKVDKWNRYEGFTIFKLPYPGCEFFEKYKNEKYRAEGLVFDWDQHFIDVEPQVPNDEIALELGIDWSMYKKWDLLQLTRNYLQYLLKVIFHGNSGLLVHCISGWDRTPLFISLLRLSLWADGEIHKNLSPVEMAYLTVAYDWFLFCHNLPNRIYKSEEIFFFCFNMLKYIDTEEFSIVSLKRNKDMDTSQSITGSSLAETSGTDAEEMRLSPSPRCSSSLSNFGPDGTPKPLVGPVSADAEVTGERSPSPVVMSPSPKKGAGVVPERQDVAVGLPTSEISAAPEGLLPLPRTPRQPSGSSSVSGESWQHVDDSGSVVGSPLQHDRSPRKRRSRSVTTDESSGTTNGTQPSTEFLLRRRERLKEVRRLVSSVYKCVVADKINEASSRSYWASSLFSAATSLLWQGGAPAESS